MKFYFKIIFGMQTNDANLNKNHSAIQIFKRFVAKIAQFL